MRADGNPMRMLHALRRQSGVIEGSPQLPAATRLSRAADLDWPDPNIVLILEDRGLICVDRHVPGRVTLRIRLTAKGRKLLQERQMQDVRRAMSRPDTRGARWEAR